MTTFFYSGILLALLLIIGFIGIIAIIAFIVVYLSKKNK